ncbi:TIGR03032 family protein [Desulfocapsa sulfexigens DSM 10523]|uniref:TIGR03032 family protein n=1 Tax=Desulfocapsa sulfexigens (strain DSM 10523 / SB164P1) TaxID=1167006 RepID=M1PTS5_DESSD|nr:TIGR03032 family protein [Desulfocapsa sulfexigens]AGF79756.1 TIGR03032 family protein [Desulfocapsa sulfexigens DSM 10523]
MPNNNTEYNSIVIQSKHFVLKASFGIENWLRSHDVSLAFSTYQSGKLLFVGLDSKQQSLSVYERNFARCMGLCLNEEKNRLLTTTLYQIWQLNNVTSPGENYKGHDKVYVPQLAFTTGKVSGHDIAWYNNRPLFVNTLFNCLATTSNTHSFIPLWKPEFISELVPEDRCHLNGLAMRDGKPYVVTSISRSNSRGGWRKKENRQNGGVVIDVASNEIVAQGLSMPHSPRFYKGKIWLLNSGKGEFGYLNKSEFIQVAKCPGYLRGLTFVDNYAIVGLSRPRGSTAFQDLVLDDLLPSLGGECCGLQVIDTQSGEIVHSLIIEGVVKELYDVITIPGSICPLLVGFESDEIERMITIGPAATL